MEHQTGAILGHYRRGLTIREIAEEMGMSEHNVKNALKPVLAEMTANVQEMREHQVTLAMARTEDHYRQTQDRIKTLDKEDHRAFRDLIKLSLDILKFQRELLEVKGPTQDNRTVNVNVVNNPTFTTESDLYEEARRMVIGEFGDELPPWIDTDDSDPGIDEYVADNLSSSLHNAEPG